MKNLWLILLCLPFLCPCPATGDSAPPPHRRYGAWVSSRLGGGGYLQRAAFTAADPDRIYLASDVGGLYRSDNGGQTWTMLHGALPPAGDASYQVRGVVAHPADPNRLLVATGNPWARPHGVFRSDDGGATFRQTLDARFEGNASSRADGAVLVADPSDPDMVYACPVGTGPWRSRDFGLTWEDLHLHDTYPRDFVVDRADPKRLWLNAVPRGEKDLFEGRPFRSGFFLSEDGGATWTNLAPAECPTEMIQDPADPGILHGLFREPPQLRRSRDRGQTWEPYANPELLPAPDKDPRKDGRYSAIAAGPDFLLVGGHGGTFYRLPANGDVWERLPNPVVHDEGWYAALTEPIERHFGAALGFVGIFPSDPARWLFTDWYACYISPDAGRTWNLAIDGIEMTVLHCLAQDPSRPDRVHAGMADIGYFRSDDGAASFGNWGRHRGISNNVKCIAVCASAPDRIYAVGPIRWQWQANQTFRSDDGGDRWRRPAQRGLPDLSEETGARCNTIAVHPQIPGEAFLCVSGPVRPGAGGIYRTRNGGDDWEWFGEGLPEASLFRRDIWTTGPEIAVSPDGSAVAVSHDSGRTFRRAPGEDRWTAVSLPDRSAHVVADPLVPGRFYIARRGAGLFRSDDGGATWRRILDAETHCVAVDAVNTSRIAATGDGLVRISRDGGDTWTEMDRSLPMRSHRNVLCFAGDRLVVGTPGSGIFFASVPLEETRF